MQSGSQKSCPFLHQLERDGIQGHRIPGRQDVDIRKNLLEGVPHAVTVLGDPDQDIDKQALLREQ